MNQNSETEKTTALASAATAPAVGLGGGVAASATTGSAGGSDHMDWEEAIGDIAGLFTDRKKESGEEAVTKTPPPSRSQRL